MILVGRAPMNGGGGGSGGGVGVGVSVGGGGGGGSGGAPPSLVDDGAAAATEREPCCLVDDGERCRRAPGNAAYNKRVQKTVTQKKLKLGVDAHARHNYICDHHKTMIQIARTKQQRRRRDSEDDSNEADADVPDVDFGQLQVNTLRRYKRHYKLPTRPGLNKAQLAETIQKHFKAQPVNEKEVLTYFIYMVKTNGNKLDQKNGLNSETI